MVKWKWEDLGRVLIVFIIVMVGFIDKVDWCKDLKLRELFK